MKSSFFNYRNEFKQVPHILNLISSYPEINKHFKCISFLSNDKLEKFQQDWVTLVEKLEHPLDKDFFKPFWVPIERDSYDYFIDLSSGTYSIFRAEFYPLEPYTWLKEYLFHDISILFQSLENKSIDLEEELEENEIDYCNDYGDIQIKREELGFAGKINPPKITNGKFYAVNKKLNSNISVNKLTITGVTPFAISLLPHDLKIKLLDFTVNMGNLVSEYQEKVNSISGFLFLLEIAPFSVINSVEFLLVPSEIGSVKWENDRLEVIHSDKNILNLIQAELHNNQINND